MHLNYVLDIYGGLSDSAAGFIASLVIVVLVIWFVLYSLYQLLFKWSEMRNPQVARGAGYAFLAVVVKGGCTLAHYNNGWLNLLLMVVFAIGVAMMFVGRKHPT